jgi:hypothetical protein
MRVTLFLKSGQTIQASVETFELIDGITEPGYHGWRAMWKDGGARFKALPSEIAGALMEPEPDDKQSDEEERSLA